ncbi:unnamed protein product [Parnassius mnemosyne]|uniref:Uncharacterized protein n=1 Tax=Parnassius mnemosyne TaxID=213953 RepID=A0AAV1LSF5_9NEOP
MTDKAKSNASEIERQLKLLTIQREYAFREIQILCDLSKNIQTDTTSASQFESRFKRIDLVRKEFLEYTNQINDLKLKLKPDDIIDMKPVIAFDDMYYTVDAARAALSEGRTRADPQCDPDPSLTYGFSYHSTKPYAQARLPKLELPKFDGNIEHWQTFFDTFSTLVHENNNIRSIEKFHYLLTCLSGSALSIAKGVPVTSDNYKIVFDALIERFQNKRILAATYLDKICCFIPLKSSNYADLRN